MVRVRVRERGGGDVIGEGKWEEVYTPVRNEGLYIYIVYIIIIINGESESEGERRRRCD